MAFCINISPSTGGFPGLKGIAGVVLTGVLSSLDSAIAGDETTGIDLATDGGLGKEDFSWEEFA
jgi:branched-subunit amino acid ABC-type transport system permease component